MFNQIQTVTGPKGNPTQALYQQISQNVNGTEPMGTSPTTNLFNILPSGETSDLYISYWVKFQPDLVEKMNNLPAGPGIDNGGTWRAFFAFKTGGQKAVTGPLNDPMNNGDYRVEVYVLTFGGGTPYWQVLADNNAGGGAPLVNNWVVQNRTVPVPVGEWFKFEIFWHRSNGADGRVWVAVNGNVIADHNGPNMGAWNLPINRISMPTVYTGSRMPVYQWIDDLEIWDGFPPAGTPAPTDTTAPSVPTGLAGSAVSSTQINLSWNPSTDNVAVVSYQVYLNNVMIANTVATSFSHIGLAPGTTYNYRVSAADAVPNYSAWTATPVSVTTLPLPDTTAPSAPTGLLASAVSSSQINLSWTASTNNVGVTGYRIYRAGALLATTGVVIGYQNTGLSASTTYSYTVQAFDAAGNASAQSALAIAITQAAPDTQAPSVPTGLTGTAVSPTQINLSWNPSTDNVAVVSYQVYLHNVMIADTTATSFQHTGLTPSTTYNYRVSAADAVPNYSAWTAVPVSVTTPARP